jgi:hypothetical protein
MRRLATAVAAVVMLGCWAGLVRGADDPTGTWKWETEVNGQKRESTLKLKLDGDKLTGASVRGDQETAIEEPTFKDGTVSFKITRDRNGVKTIRKYSGKLDGDTIKGKIETERDGQTQTADWEAKRSK